MKKLHQIVKERFEKQKELSEKTNDFKAECKKLDAEIQELLRLEAVGQSGAELDKVQIAEEILNIQGDPFGVVDGGSAAIADLAVIDVAEDFIKMRNQYFGNKKYSGYYQRCNCEYGMGPKHGTIVDRIELKDTEREYTDEEKDACIYYIKNYKEISNLEKVK